MRNQRRRTCSLTPNYWLTTSNQSVAPVDAQYRSRKRRSRKLQSDHSRTELFHVFWRSTIAFHRQRRAGTHPKTTSIHHGEERELSRLRDDGPVFFRPLKSDFFRTERERETDTHRRSVSGYGSREDLVMGYRTLFEGSDIHHSNSGLQITHEMYINHYSCYSST